MQDVLFVDQLFAVFLRDLLTNQVIIRINIANTTLQIFQHFADCIRHLFTEIIFIIFIRYIK